MPIDPAEELVKVLARTAVRTIYAGVVRDATLLQEIQDAGKNTPELVALTQASIPQAAKDWVAANFWDPGVVRDAVESEVRIALSRHACLPVATSSVHYQMTTTADEDPTCNPMCIGP